MTCRSEALDAPELEAFVEIHPGDEREVLVAGSRNALRVKSAPTGTSSTPAPGSRISIRKLKADELLGLQMGCGLGKGAFLV
jgi:hypothetical protein